MVFSLTTAGVALTAAAVTLLVLSYSSRPRAARFSLYGYLGLAMIAVGEWLMFQQVEPIFTYFTPWAWTGYILAADAAVFALRGRSLLRSDPRELAAMALWSIPLWMIFEGYNLHLRNWIYYGVGMQLGLPAELFGRAWAYATIVPALLVSADLLAALGWFERASARGWGRLLRFQKPMMGVGVAFLIVPLLLPHRWAVYLFSLVWLGFIFLFEPLNYRRGHPSVLRDLEENRGQRFYCLLAGGLFCGLLWEFWNYWAGGRWEYIFPLAQGWKLFEMPLPGYLGFPFFALECYALYYFVSRESRRFAFRQQNNQ